MKKLYRILCLMVAMALLASALTGCAERSDPFQVMVAAPYVGKDQVREYGEKLAGEREILFSDFSFGTEENDPTTYSAGAMIMTTIMVAGELDVLVCDLENAPRYARSELFMDLTEVFTQEELEPYADRLLTFPLVDEEGSPLQERTPVCGIDLTGNEPVAILTAGEPCGIFIIANTGDLDLAKEVFWEILTGENS